jgi:3'-5' exoribonuclease
MDGVSIRELKQRALGAGAGASEALRFHAQLQRKAEKTTKTGNPFYELTFADAEESLVLRVWNNAPMFGSCSELLGGRYYEIAGEFGLGGDGRSVDGRSWTARALGEEEAAAVLAGSEELRRKQEADYAWIEEAVSALADPRLRVLCAAFLERYGKRLRRTAGARDYHHARRGGLVEHVAGMMRSAVKVCEAYPMLNRDLLVAGVLFHDIGKLWENAYQPEGFAMPYTEISELIGHIPLGMEVVNRLWREWVEPAVAEGGWDRLEPPSERVRLHLLHLVVSHHGELEFGSPVVPKTPEAQALHYIDNLDAKMEMFERGYLVAAELGERVYDRVRPLPGRLVSALPKFEGAAAAESGPADGADGGDVMDEAATEEASEPF